jgi:type II secretory pathway pseudopilin PulG
MNKNFQQQQMQRQRQQQQQQRQQQQLQQQQMQRQRHYQQMQQQLEMSRRAGYAEYLRREKEAEDNWATEQSNQLSWATPAHSTGHPFGAILFLIFGLGTTALIGIGISFAVSLVTNGDVALVWIGASAAWLLGLILTIRRAQKIWRGY